MMASTSVASDDISLGSSVGSSATEATGVSLRDRSLKLWSRLGSSIRGNDDSFMDDDTIFSHKIEQESRERVRQQALEARQQAEETREQERKFARFKRDEAFVMDKMNEILENEMKDCERKRLAKLREEERIKQLARQRNQQGQQRIRKMLLQDAAQTPLAMRGGGTRKSVRAHLDENSSRSTETAATIEESSLEALEELNISFESSDEDEDVDENSYSDYHKTIRWDSSVDEELERRTVHRVKHPTKKGGIARRIRKKSKQTVFIEDGEDITDIMAEGEQGVEQMISEYRQAMKTC